MVQPVSGILLLRGVAGNSEGCQARDSTRLEGNPTEEHRPRQRQLGSKWPPPVSTPKDKHWRTSAFFDGGLAVRSTIPTLTTSVHG